jgi:hypothetical protein
MLHNNVDRLENFLLAKIQDSDSMFQPDTMDSTRPHHVTIPHECLNAQSAGLYNGIGSWPPWLPMA